ncbi:hypothetical protein T492DRAFT_887342 [Pavlovales sp. CCMP2436]|nr:hypothetical protein T492DRAFT_887342 [Pavlovales sp. CCMP2436]
MLATFKGSVTLRVSHGNAEAVSIAVSDTGKGLDPKDPNVFERYQQPSAKKPSVPTVAKPSDVQQSRTKLESDLSLSSGNEGIGIGLSLSYACVQALGGELRYDSQPGATCFQIAEVGIFEASRAPHVLIVDDSRLCLKRLGCKTDTADDGVEAVAKLRSAVSGFYQLVLMDIRMPNMAELFDGFQPKPLSVDALTKLLNKFLPTYKKLTVAATPAKAAA